ncbi:MAG: intein-containing Rv2578c family radical SAM protein [Streptosporangiaceae bacterium]
MRWDSLRLTEAASGQAAAPALFERAAVARTFDTPGFRGITFHEVHAKTIISKVPAASRVPFDWTINPYRGCSHACTYCVAGETPLLMADGRTKPIARVRVGDVIYGTVRRGHHRRYVPTSVLAHWQTVKPAYRITLADGTSLIASEDHRFLTGRGWQYVTGAEHGSTRRPHLTSQSELLGVGAFSQPPKECPEYRRGYLCGMIHGGGHRGYRDEPGESGGSDGYRSRPAVNDSAALERTSNYLALEGIARSELVQWPAAPSSDWRKGFLAGIFDAAGSCDEGILRISTTDPSVIGWAMSSFAALGLDVAVEPVTRATALTVLRLRGGLTERLRFFHSTDPVITRKRLIDGVAIKSDAKLKVASIEPLGLDVPMYDITTGTGDFIANGVVSHNCFARNTHTYLDMDAGHDFDTQIVVKVNAGELLRRELAAPRWRGEHIAMGTNVDCYQRAEGRYELMPGIIQALTAAANPFSILTKGTLVLRDIDLLAEAAEVTDVGLNVSVGIIDRDLSRLVEPGTPAPERRLAACATLNERRLPCGVLMGPVLPYLTDSPADLDRAVREIAAAGATHVSPIVLHLRPGAREWFLHWLRDCYPNLVPAYAKLYGSRAYAPASYQQSISERVAALAKKYGVGHTRPAGARRVSAGGRGAHRQPNGEANAAAGADRGSAANGGTQLSLL